MKSTGYAQVNDCPGCTVSDPNINVEPLLYAKLALLLNTLTMSCHHAHQSDQTVEQMEHNDMRAPIGPYDAEDHGTK